MTGLDILGVVWVIIAWLQSTDSVQFTLETAVLVVGLLAQTGVFFYWGGRVHRSVQVLEQETERMRERWHGQIVALLTDLNSNLDEIRHLLSERRER